MGIFRSETLLENIRLARGGARKSRENDGRERGEEEEEKKTGPIRTHENI